MAIVTPSLPKTKEINSSGGTAAPSGASVAAKMVKNSRSAVTAPKVSRVPRPAQQRQPSVKVPRGRGGNPNPYNALKSPYRTQGEFNKAVTETTKAGYQPKLNELSTEEEGEKGLSAQRESDNVNIFKQYSQQANEAYEKAKSTMAEIAARQNAGSAASQQVLQSALSNTGVAGLSGVTNPSAYMEEASGLGRATSQSLAAEQSGIAGEMSKNLLTPGIGLEEATGENQARSQGLLNKYASERDKITRGIPEDTEKVRQELMKDEETREANRLQANIAGQKLGIEKEARVEVGKEKNQIAREVGREKNEATEKVKREEVGIKEAEVQNKKKAYEEKILVARNKQEVTTAKIEAARYNNGLKVMTEYLKENPKTEYRPGSINPSEQQAALHEGKIEYRRDAGHLYKMLTEQANLTPEEAYKLMRSSGNGYIEQFAHTEEQKLAQEALLRNTAHTPTQKFKIPAARK